VIKMREKKSRRGIAVLALLAAAAEAQEKVEEKKDGEESHQEVATEG